MQHRMKEFQMSQEAMDKVLTENQVGHVATIGKDIAIQGCNTGKLCRICLSIHHEKKPSVCSPVI